MFQDSLLLVAQLIWSSRIVRHKKTFENYMQGCTGNVCNYLLACFQDQLLRLWNQNEHLDDLTVPTAEHR